MNSGAGRRVIKMHTGAKVNLFLRVAGRRVDGYHEVETILHGIDLCDDIVFELTDTRRIEIIMEVAGGGTRGLPAMEENLIYRAATRLVDRGARNEGLRVHVVKRIPIAAGLGGGSGNAAGAILALNDLWGLELPPEEQLEVAASIGTDVPYCLTGGTAIATGRGDSVTGLSEPQPISFVLGLSDEPMYTRDVYAVHDASRDGGPTSESMSQALGASDIEEVARLLRNDLERAAVSLRPELEGKREALLHAGALGARVSGSGPTVFGVARDPDHARHVAGRVRSHFDRVLVTNSKPEAIERLD